MKIAQVAPLYESVPPQLYGGTERVVSYLTEELVRQGHDVTLFASGDSITTARLEPICAARAPARYALGGPARAPCPDARAGRPARARVRHRSLSHRLPALPAEPAQPAATTVTTLHGRLDIPDLRAALRRVQRHAGRLDLRRPARAAAARQLGRHRATTACRPTCCPFSETPDDYLAFLGRISPEKRVDRAIEIARRAGMPLRVAAKIDAADREYFERGDRAAASRSRSSSSSARSTSAQKAEFLGGARRCSFPIDWREPFGLVMIEAMACGTPVVACRGGSVREVISTTA